MAPTFDPWPKLLPAYGNLAWNIPATFTDEKPLLAVVVLETRRGINLLEPGTPFNNLLRKALEYCSSLPETRINYGAIRDDPSSVILLVELPSAHAWQDFQASAVLDLLVATFECNPTCYCLLWSPPQSFDVSSGVELLTVQLDAATGASGSNRRRQFDQTWAAFSKAVTEIGDYHVHGNWVEAYCMANPFWDSPPGRRDEAFAAYDAQPATFLGVTYGDCSNSDALKDAVSELVQQSEGRVLRRTLDLKHYVALSQDLYAPHSSPGLLASPLLLFDPVKPAFRRNNGMSYSGEDMTWRSNYYAARKAKALGFPEPRGGFHPVALANQYTCPTYLDTGDVADAPSPMVDALCLTFRSGALDATDNQAEQLLERFRQFRQDVAALEHCEALHWARKHGEANVVVLFIGKQCALGMMLKPADRAIVWRSRQDRPENLLTVCNPLLQRSGILTDLECEPLQRQSFAISTSALISLQLVEHLELITFCTPDNIEAKRLLQIHARRYSDTALVARVVAGRGSAGQCINSGYAVQQSGEDAALISMWTWRDLDARERWYSQFHEIVRENFERLGHIVDGVRLVATGGIHFELLDVQMDVFGYSV